MMKWKYGHITGVILAGGQCASDEGANKALLLFDGKPLIQHIAETLQEVFDKVIVISDHPADFEFLNLPIFPDIIKDGGPLGDIHSALVNIETEEAFIVSADMPFIRKDVIHYILKMENGADITIINSEGKLQPFCGIYKSSCILPIAKNYLRGFISLQSFLNQVTIREITPDITMQSLVRNALASLSSGKLTSPGLAFAG